MSLPKEPRQLMINLMYLVLTAMLALNVSNEILHAFKVINESVSASNVSIVDKNAKLYSDFDANEREEGQGPRVKPYNDKAKQVKKAADEMYAYLEEWKEKIVAESGGRDPNGEIRREDNIDASTLLLVERKGGDEVKERLQKYRDFLLSVVSDSARKNLSKQLPVRIVEPERSENNPQSDWKVGYFHNMPTMAVTTLFAKFQNDVRNSEAQIVNQLFNEAASEQVRFDAFEAIAIPKTSYALAGQKVEASIMLAAYNRAVNPSVNAAGGGGRIVKVENGIANWETNASGVGLQTVKGNVTIDMGGRKITKDYQFQYMVGSTGASMQLDKMNVFYIGVPNPITVSAAGYALEDILVNIPGGTVTPGAAKGQYNVMVDKPGEITAAINAKDGNTVKPVGTMKVRVKMIPDPVAEIGGKSQGAMSASTFRAQLGPIAAMKGFEFDARFRIVSFALSIVPKRGEMRGPYTAANNGGTRFTDNPEIPKAIAQLKPGDRVFIEEIKAIGPDNSRRNLNPIILLLN